MKKPIRKNGFSLIELQVSILIASILVLTIGAISSISLKRYRNLQAEAKIYSDISYGFKLIRNRVRTSSSLSLLNAAGNWKSERLVIRKEAETMAFGIYQSDEDGAPLEFVFLQDASNENDREVIFTAKPSELSLIWSCDTANCLTAKYLTVTLNGEFENQPFNIASTVSRRL